MKPDIWMPIYPGDYLRDTMHLTTEQHGAYFLLMLHYWTHGPLQDDDEELSQITKLLTEQWAVMRKRLEKFFIVGDGAWRHKRIEVELDKAKRHKQAKSDAGIKGMEARWHNRTNNTAITEAITEPITKHNPSPSPSPSRSVRTPPRLEEVISWSEMDGIPASDAERFFHHFDSTGWIDKNGNLIVNPRSKLKTWSTENVARPHEKSHHSNENNHEPTFWELSKQLEQVDAEIKQIEMRASHTATDTLIQPADKDIYKKLRTSRSQLKKQLNLR